MRTKLILGAIFCVVLLGEPTAPLAGPTFLSYEGPDAVHSGQGGEKKTVNGIDFWLRGDPPRRFKILGSLTDRRHESGLIGMVRMSALDSDIAKAAKAAGGDAVVLQGEDTDVTGSVGFASTQANAYGNSYGNIHPGGYSGGYQGHADATTFATSRSIREHDARYIVVAYLPDEPAGLPVQSAPAQSTARQSLPAQLIGSTPAAPATAPSPSPRSGVTAAQPTQDCGAVQQRDGSVKLVPC